ncbi:MAG: helix-turn-helix domain-containing protein [Gaiellaceae bacterium]
MKTEQRELARTIRRQEGAPIKEIARRVGVAPSSVSRWVRDIELTAAQERELLRRNPAYNRQLSGTAKQAANRRAERIAYQEAGRRLALQGDRCHVAGCMLYWAEGEKDRNTLRFYNSDPEMVRFFVVFLKKYFDLQDEEIKITCNLFADHIQRRHEIEQFWLDVAQLSKCSLCKSYVNVYSRHSKRKRTNRLPYGTVRVTVCRTRVVQGIFGSIQEYAGFERDAWLE